MHAAVKYHRYEVAHQLLNRLPADELMSENKKKRTALELLIGSAKSNVNIVQLGLDMIEKMAISKKQKNHVRYLCAAAKYNQKTLYKKIWDKLDLTIQEIRPYLMPIKEESKSKDMDRHFESMVEQEQCSVFAHGYLYASIPSLHTKEDYLSMSKATLEVVGYCALGGCCLLREELGEVHSVVTAGHLLILKIFRCFRTSVSWSRQNLMPLTRKSSGPINKYKSFGRS